MPGRCTWGVYRHCHAVRMRDSQAEAVQLENVVRGAHQRPLGLHLRVAAQQEPTKATRLFDLSEHWFDHRFAGRVHRGPGLGVELARPYVTFIEAELT